MKNTKCKKVVTSGKGGQAVGSETVSCFISSKRKEKIWRKQENIKSFKIVSTQHLSYHSVHTSVCLTFFLKI